MRSLLMLTLLVAGGCQNAEERKDQAPLPVPSPASEADRGAADKAVRAQHRTAAGLKSALATIGSGRTRALLDVAADVTRPPRERRGALMGLELFADPAAIPELAQLCRPPASAELVDGAVQALSVTAHPRAVAVLSGLTEQPGINPARRGVLGLADWGRRSDATLVLGALERATRHASAPVSAAALRAIAEVGGPAQANVFRRLLGAKDAAVRRDATAGIARHGSQTDAPRLAKALKDPFGPVALAAASGLARLGDAATIPALIGYLNGDRREAIDPVLRALGAMKAGAAREAIERRLGDRDGYVRAVAAKTLGDLGDPQALSALLPLLAATQRNVSIAAAGAIRRLANQDAAAGQVLQQALANQKDEAIKTALAQALAGKPITPATASEEEHLPPP